MAGAETLIGAGLVDYLRGEGYGHVQVACGSALEDAREVDAFFRAARPEYVFFAAGKSGGIHANQAYPATLMRDNLLTATHVIDGAHRHGVTKLLYLASSCSYPRLAPQPMRVECLLTGPLEPTNEAYALAKLAGLKLCQAYRHEHHVNFIAGIPANAFGPKDDFSPEDSHVIPGLIRKLDDARDQRLPEFPLWGTGQARREFIYVRDLADACVFAMQHYDGAEPLNLGGGRDLSILETAQAIAEVVGYRGTFRLDPSKPDGMPRKGLDSSKLEQLGWRPKTDFHTALRETYEWYLSNRAEAQSGHVILPMQERTYRAAV